MMLHVRHVMNDRKKHLNSDMIVQTITFQKKKKKSDFNRISDHIWMFTNIRFMFFFFQNGFESDPIFSACLNKALKSHCDETRAADNDSHADSWKEGLLYRATAD